MEWIILYVVLVATAGVLEGLFWGITGRDASHDDVKSAILAAMVFPPLPIFGNLFGLARHFSKKD